MMGDYTSSGLLLDIESSLLIGQAGAGWGRLWEGQQGNSLTGLGVGSVSGRRL